MRFTEDVVGWELVAYSGLTSDAVVVSIKTVRIGADDPEV
jgi:hypothetical protein